MKKVKESALFVFIVSCLLFNGCFPRENYYRKCDDGSYLEITCAYENDLDTKNGQIIINKDLDNELRGSYEIISNDEKDRLTDEIVFQKHELYGTVGERYVYISDKEIKFLFLFADWPEEFDDKFWFLATFDGEENNINSIKESLTLYEKSENENDGIIYGSHLETIGTFRITRDTYTSYKHNIHSLKEF